MARTLKTISISLALLIVVLMLGTLTSSAFNAPYLKHALWAQHNQTPASGPAPVSKPLVNKRSKNILTTPYFSFGKSQIWTGGQP